MILERGQLGLEDEPPEIEGPPGETDKERELREKAARWEYLATHDSLTGVLNLLGFELAAKSALQGKAPEIPAGAPRLQSMEKAPERKEVDFTKSCLLYFDLDHFKGINDGLGHACGDEALIAITNFWRENIREYDIFGRKGGDEFVIIFRGVSAAEVQERFKDESGMASVNFSVIVEGQRFNLSLSGGLVDIKPEENKTLSQILNEADDTLYTAKRGGRNRLMTLDQVKGLEKKTEEASGG